MTAADRCGISEAQLNPLVGHTSRSIQQRHYIDPPTLPERAQRVERLAAYYAIHEPAVYEPGQFDGYIAERRKEEQRAKAVTARKERRTKGLEHP